MQQRPPSRAGTSASRSARPGGPSGRPPRRPRSGRVGFRIDDRVLLASVLVVLGVSLVVFAGLIVSGADRLGGGDDNEGSELLAQDAGITTGSPAALVPPPVSTASAVTAVPTPASDPAASAGGHVVCLDVGHGGVDEGNVMLSDDGTEILAQEKDFTLAQSLELRDRLETQGVRVVLTRETDTEVNATFADVNGDGEVANDLNGDGEIDTRQGEFPNEVDELQARVNVCNEAGADLLVSIHVNSSEDTGLKGYEAWYAADNQYSDQSALAAQLLTGELGTEFAAVGYETVFRGAAPDSALPTPDDPNLFKNFIMLSPDFPPQNYVGAKMPSVIVECLFLSNEDDAAFLVGNAEVAQNAIVSAYETAILDYFAEELAEAPRASETEGGPAPAPPPTTAAQPVPDPTGTPAADEAETTSVSADLDAIAAANNLPAPLADTGSGRSQVHYYGDSGRKEIALTFDLGSDRGYTEEILDFLQERGIRASFGLTGLWAEQNPDLVQRIVDEGHQLFNHTYSHSSFTGASPGTEPLTREERIAEIERTDQIIFDMTGYNMKPYFRLPYGDGADDPDVMADIYGAGYYLTIMWTCDSYGWKKWTAAEIIQNCLATTGIGGIVLMHVGSDGTDQLALPGLVDEFAADGFSFVTVAEVLAPAED